jgi:colicin import membrane protein
VSASSLRLGAGPDFRNRPDPGYGRSIALALGVHLLLIAVLFFGVRFQSSPPEAVTVELWDAPSPQRAAEPPPPAPPKVEPKVDPKPEPPPPPKPEVKPEPKVEKPEIVEKAAPKPKPEPKPEPKPAPKPEPKPKPKPKPKPEPKPPARDLEFEKRMREELAQEQAASEARSVRAQLALEQAAAASRALATWEGKIRAKIRSNIRQFVVDQVQGNPEAVFHVALLPTGEVLSASMVKSSGNKAYDEEVRRAISASSPLPKPEPASLFRRDLELKFRPQDQ